MKFKLLEFCNGELVQVRTCKDKAELNSTILKWKSVKCPNQRFDVEYLE